MVLQDADQGHGQARHRAGPQNRLKILERQRIRRDEEKGQQGGLVEEFDQGVQGMCGGGGRKEGGPHPAERRQQEGGGDRAKVPSPARLDEPAQIGQRDAEVEGEPLGDQHILEYARQIGQGDDADRQTEGGHDKARSVPRDPEGRSLYFPVFSSHRMNCSRANRV